MERAGDLHVCFARGRTFVFWAAERNYSLYLCVSCVVFVVRNVPLWLDPCFGNIWRRVRCSPGPISWASRPRLASRLQELRSGAGDADDPRTLGRSGRAPHGMLSLGGRSISTRRPSNTPGSSAAPSAAPTRGGRANNSHNTAGRAAPPGAAVPPRPADDGHETDGSVSPIMADLDATASGADTTTPARPRPAQPPRPL